MKTLLRWFDRWKRGLPSGHALSPDIRAGASADERERTQRDILATRRELVGLAWPIATAMLGDTLMGLVDTRLVGQLGAAAQGGVGLGSTIVWIGFAFGLGFLRAIKVRASHAIGADRERDVPAYARAGLVAAVVVGLMLFWLTRDIRPLLRILKPDALTVEPAVGFVNAFCVGAPAMFAMQALVQYCQSVGDTRTPMVVQLAGNVLNGVLAWALIYGHLGMPALGVRGAGYATATVHWVTFLALAWRVRKPVFAASTLSLRVALREVVEVGLPTGFAQAFEVCAFATFTAVLAGIGAAEIAAHQIAMSVIRVSFLPAFAIAEAGSVLVGRALGAKDLARADRAAMQSLRFAIVFMTACGVVFALLGGPIASGFNSDVMVVQVARKLLLLAAVFQTLDAATITFRCVLRAAKEVRFVAVVGVLVVWTSVPGAAWLLGNHAHWGAVGGWCGFLAETALSTWIFSRHWARGAWRAKFAAGSIVQDKPAKPALIVSSVAAA